MSEKEHLATFNPDRLRAEAAIRKAAKAGNPEAQFRLGVMFGNGDGVGLDYEQARSWFEKAAAQGHENALITLAWMYANGTGVDGGRGTCARAVSRGGHGGVGQGPVRGRPPCIALPSTVWKKDFNAAVEWYLKAADQGMPTAQLALGKMLMEGKGRHARRCCGSAVVVTCTCQRQQAGRGLCQAPDKAHGPR